MLAHRLSALFVVLALYPFAPRQTEAASTALQAGQCDAKSFVGSQVLPDHPGRWGVMPAFPGSTSETQSWLILKSKPGQTQCTGAVIVNYTSKPIPLTIWVTDALTGQDGAFTTVNQDQPIHGVGRWTKLGLPSTVTVPPHRFYYVPVKISVPRHTPVGKHAGAIEARTPYLPLSGKGSMHFNVATQIGLRIYLTVPGRPRVDPEWSNLICGVQGDNLKCSVKLHNNGSTALQGDGSVNVNPLWGNSTHLTLQPPVRGELLPDDSEKLVGHLSHLQPGIYRAVASLKAGGRVRKLQVTVFVPPSTPPIIVFVTGLLLLSWRRSRRAIFGVFIGAFQGAFRGAGSAWKPQTPG